MDSGYGAASQAMGSAVVPVFEQPSFGLPSGLNLPSHGIAGAEGSVARRRARGWGQIFDGLRLRWREAAVGLALLLTFSPSQGAPSVNEPTVLSGSSWDFVSLLPGSGLARRSIFSISFETNSTAWIAGSDGLYRYDGYSWRRYVKQDGLPSDFVRSVLVDHEGQVWAGTDNGLGCFDGKSFTTLSPEHGLAGRSVRRIFQDADGALWFACDRWPNNSWEGGLSCLKEGVWKTYRQADGLPSDYVFSYFRDARGHQYVFTAAGTARRAGDRWVPMDEPGFPTNHQGNHVVESSQGLALVQLRRPSPPLLRQDGHWQSVPSGGTGPLCATRRGEVFNVAYGEESKELWIQKLTGQHFEPVSPVYSCPYGWVEAMAEAPDGSIWCVGPDVLLRWLPTGGEWTAYAALPPARLVDARQRVWFADTNQAVRLTPTGWERVPGFRGQLGRDSTGRVWSWTDESITSWGADGPETFNSAQTGLIDVRRMAVDGQDNAWFCGRTVEGRTALAVRTADAWRCHPVPELGERTVVGIAGDAHAGVWLLASERRMTPRALAHLRSDQPIAWYDVPPSTIDYRDSGLLVDGHAVWMYGSSGLYRLELAKRGAWTQISGLLGSNVYGALADSARTCFVFDGRSGGGSGYLLFQGETMRQFKADVEWSWFNGQDGTFYLKEQGGFLVVPPEVDASPFHLALPEDTRISGLVQGDNHSLWLNSPKAVLHYQPNPDPPRTVLADCDERVRQGDPLRLTLRGAKRWAPHHPQEAFRFSWRLDKEPWSRFQPPPPKGIPTATLAPGAHHLAVRCRLEGRKEDPAVATLEFVVAAIPLQERAWFPAAVAALFGSLLLLAASALVARHKLALSASRLEQTVRDRTEELVQTNQSLRREIDERKRAEAEKEKLQGQLLQAQKIESIGRLAGGIAHDFNNMLQVILGNVALSLERAPAHSQLQNDLLEIQGAAERSADLTRQLLGFARKQTVNPKVLDLNRAISGMLKMLRRLVGEGIQLVWIEGKDLASVEIDPAQVDQILANLTVNARDAIPGIGRIVLETANATFDAAAAQAHPDCLPGDYVLLAVSDTGCGMDPETLSHVFEPFFTTKGPGEGTGLGLATVYGIVKQNRGFITVDSRKGSGTTFKLYLPRAQAPAAATAVSADSRPRRGAETVMLVEDEEPILNLGRRVLEQHGYTVLAALAPAEALYLARHHAGPIHLVVTDVVMPGMNGRDLWNRLTALKPGLKCLFMSGYTADVIAHQSVLDEGLQFLPKPFAVDQLARRVREILDSSPTAS